jgi:hypothetical protein
MGLSTGEWRKIMKIVREKIRKSLSPQFPLAESATV